MPHKPKTYEEAQTYAEALATLLEQALTQDRYNENHGANGRFAAGGGGSSGGSGGGGGKASGRLNISSQDFANAELHQFGDSYNTTYKTTINGKEYFVKEMAAVDPSSDYANQMKSELLGRDLAVMGGLENQTIPVGTVERGGKTYLIQEWTNATPIFDMPQSEVDAAFNNLSRSDATNMLLHEYILNDDDRHMGNYLYDKTSGTLMPIDFGLAGSMADSELSTSSVLVNHLMGRQPPFELSVNSLRSYARKIPSMYNQIKQAGYTPEQLAAFRQRLGVIRYMSKNINYPTIQDMKNAGDMGFALEIPHK